MNKNNHGYVAIIAVLILSLVSLIVAVSFTELSIGEGQSSRSQLNQEKTLMYLESCAEDLFLRLSLDKTALDNLEQVTIFDQDVTINCRVDTVHSYIIYLGYLIDTYEITIDQDLPPLETNHKILITVQLPSLDSLHLDVRSWIEL